MTIPVCSDSPWVTVMLATFNGEAWLVDQLASLARQRDVRVRVVVSDDGSGDGTLDVLARARDRLPIDVMPPCPRMGSANLNFLRMICEGDVGDSDYVAFCDQDDIWFDDKLSRAVEAISQRSLDGYSSDVLAFWPDGRARPLKKGEAQRSHDHLFEAPGPGCSIVLKRSAFDSLRRFARARRDALGPLKHDWWIYARSRVEGWRWFIDPRPSLHYRQHEANEVGANVGWAAARRRWQAVRSGQYRTDALAVADAVGESSSTVDLLRRYGWWDRCRLAWRARKCRRRPHEACLLAVFHLLAR